MKDDKIKKCLIAGYDLNIINQEELNEYWNYITNLQKENEKLKSKIDEVVNKQQFIEEKYDYKLRNEKALEFIDKYCIDDEFYLNLTYKEKAIIEVKKILQGDDK